jgi:4'-phosphopantetheinyl transferase
MIPLLPQQIDFWRLPIRPLSEGRYREYFLGLSIEERVLHDAFYFSADRLRHLLTRFFLRRVMAAYLNQDAGRLEFSQNTYGRPALSGHQNYIALDFNVAHNEDYIVCAVSRNGRVGVDIENYRKPCNLALAEDFFAHQELAQLLARNDTQRDKHFCELWTLKESFIKAVGKGMAIPLDAFYFQFDEDSHAFSDPEKTRREPLLAICFLGIRQQKHSFHFRLLGFTLPACGDIALKSIGTRSDSIGCCKFLPE